MQNLKIQRLETVPSVLLTLLTVFRSSCAFHREAANVHMSLHASLISVISSTQWRTWDLWTDQKHFMWELGGHLSPEWSQNAAIVVQSTITNILWFVLQTKTFLVRMFLTFIFDLAMFPVVFWSTSSNSLQTHQGKSQAKKMCIHFHKISMTNIWRGPCIKKTHLEFKPSSCDHLANVLSLGTCPISSSDGIRSYIFPVKTTFFHLADLPLCIWCSNLV